MSLNAEQQQEQQQQPPQQQQLHPAQAQQPAETELINMQGDDLPVGPPPPVPQQGHSNVNNNNNNNANNSNIGSTDNFLKRTKLNKNGSNLHSYIFKLENVATLKNFKSAFTLHMLNDDEKTREKVNVLESRKSRKAIA